MNPEKVFGGMLFYGFANQVLFEGTVAELARIEECGWARQMIEGEFPPLLRDAAQDRTAVFAALEAEARDALGSRHAIGYEVGGQFLGLPAIAPGSLTPTATSP